MMIFKFYGDFRGKNKDFVVVRTNTELQFKTSALAHVMMILGAHKPPGVVSVVIKLRLLL